MSKLTIKLIKGGDITKTKVDAIVNAANYQLLGGNGVCGAIYGASGCIKTGKAWAGDLVDETRDLGPISTGTSAISKPYDLSVNTKAIIHAVGPVFEDGYRGEDILLASAYTSALELALGEDYTSIAFPCISTGVYGFPHDRAAQVAVKAVVNCMQSKIDNGALDEDFEVVFLAFLDDDFDPLKAAIEKEFGTRDFIISDLSQPIVPASPLKGDILDEV
jgi:O-acetyl-ADP-ribose deacetylase (regulator of RNase III)